MHTLNYRFLVHLSAYYDDLAVSTPEGFDAMLALLGMGRGKKADSFLPETILTDKEEEEEEEDYTRSERNRTGLGRVENCREEEEDEAWSGKRMVTFCRPTV